MTTIKLDSKIGAAADAALEPYVGKLYSVPGMRLLVIAEVKSDETNRPAPDSDKGTWARVRITQLEVAAPEQEAAVRDAMRALYLQRTAYGTLTDDGQMELSEETLRLTGDLLLGIEAARLRAGLHHWSGYARRVVAAEELTVSEIRHELDTIADGLTATLTSASTDGAEGV